MLQSMTVAPMNFLLAAVKSNTTNDNMPGDDVKIGEGKQRGFKCDICSKLLKTPVSLQNHGRVHSNERPHPCPDCEKAFKTNTELVLHYRVHTGERPYICTVCGFAFAQQCNLRSHLRTHSENRPCKCSKCEKSFKSTKSLKLHSRIHSGERPYKCPICPKTFIQKSNCNIHMKVHKGEKTRLSERSSTERVDRHLASGSTLAYSEMDTHTTGGVGAVMLNQKSADAATAKYTLLHKPIAKNIPETRDIKVENFDDHLDSVTQQDNCHNILSVPPISIHSNMDSVDYHSKADEPIENNAESDNSELNTVNQGGYKYNKGMKLSTSTTLKRHQRVHFGYRNYFCPASDKSFRSSVDLTQHFRTHSGEQPYKCTMCYRAFSQHCNWKTHMMLHTCDRPHKCSVCLKDFKSKWELRLHLRTHSRERPYKCTVCSNTFVQHLHWRLHMELHTRGNNTTSRESCRSLPANDERHDSNCMDTRPDMTEKSTTENSEMVSLNLSLPDRPKESTLASSHNVEIKSEQLDDSGDVKTLNSDIGKMPVASAQSHVKVELDTDDTNCESFAGFCDVIKEKLLASSSSNCSTDTFREPVTKNGTPGFTSNIKGVKKLCQRKSNMCSVGKAVNGVNKSQTSICECHTCGKIFNKMRYLLRHRKIHSDDRKYLCTVCKKPFRTKNELTIHFRVHSGQKPYLCKICKMVFSQQSSLATHMKRHNDNRPYKCAECPKSFRVSRDLNTHIRVHSGEEPYFCKICKVRFSQRCNLATHLKRHSDSKPYKCEVCPKRFRFPRDLNTHFRVHSGEKPYQCPHCEHACTQLCNLKSHMRVHSERCADTNTYTCVICSQKFMQQEHLIDHVYDIHCWENTLKQAKASVKSGGDCSNDSDSGDHALETSVSHETVVTSDVNTKINRNDQTTCTVGLDKGNQVDKMSSPRNSEVEQDEYSANCEFTNDNVPQESSPSYKGFGEDAFVSTSNKVNVEAESDFRKCEIPKDYSLEVNKDELLLTKVEHSTQKHRESDMSLRIDGGTIVLASTRMEGGMKLATSVDEIFHTSGAKESEVISSVENKNISNISSVKESEITTNLEKKKKVNTSSVNKSGTDTMMENNEIPSSSSAAVSKGLKTGSKTPVVCDVCDNVYSDKRSLIRHKKRHQTEVDLCCRVCNKSCLTKYELHAHMKEHKVYKEQSFQCITCNAPFTKNSSLLKHMKTHREEITLTCPICSETFLERKSFVVHMRMHNGENTYCCPTCGDIFSTSSVLIEHSKVHNRKKSYRCSICKRTFSDKDLFNCHMDNHNMRKIHKCPECGKSFRLSCELLLHSRIHTNDRRYPCKLCNRAFVQSCNLLKHMRTVHNTERPFMCYICGGRFKQKYVLKVHLQKVHKIDFLSITEEQCIRVDTLSGPTKTHLAKNVKSSTLVNTSSAYELAAPKVQAAVSGVPDVREIKTEYCDSDQETIIDKNEQGSVGEPLQENVDESIPGRSICRNRQKNTVSDSVASDVVSEIARGEIIGENVQRKVINENVQENFAKQDLQGNIFKENVLGHIVIKNEQGNVSDNVQVKTIESVQGHFIEKQNMADEASAPPAMKIKVEIDIDYEECETAPNGHHTQHPAKVHSGEKMFTCTVCGRSFNRKCYWKNHIKVHRGTKIKSVKPHSGPVPVRADSMSHSRKHNGEKPHLCYVCGNRFLLKCHLSRHMKKHSRELELQSCVRKVDSVAVTGKVHSIVSRGAVTGDVQNTDRKVHNKTVSGEIHWGGKVHSRAFSGDVQSRDRKVDSEAVTGVPSTDSTEGAKPRDVETTQAAQKEMDYADYLLSLEINSEAKNDKPLPSNNKFNPGTGNMADENSAWWCGNCGKSCKTRKELTMHMLQSHNERLYEVIHSQNSNTASIYKCLVCGQQRGSFYYINKHTRIHKIAKPCTYCNKKFASKKLLEAHVRRMHRTQVPYACVECDKSFRSETELVAHCRVHTGEKPYRCAICTRTFSQFCNWDRHRMTHSSERPHKCMECGEAFKTKQMLEGHYKSCKGKPFKCKLCPNTYASIKPFKAHMKQHENMKAEATTGNKDDKKGEGSIEGAGDPSSVRKVHEMNLRKSKPGSVLDKQRKGTKRAKKTSKSTSAVSGIVETPKSTVKTLLKMDDIKSDDKNIQTKTSDHDESVKYKDGPVVSHGEFMIENDIDYADSSFHLEWDDLLSTGNGLNSNPNAGNVSTNISLQCPSTTVNPTPFVVTSNEIDSDWDLCDNAVTVNSELHSEEKQPITEKLHFHGMIAAPIIIDVKENHNSSDTVSDKVNLHMILNSSDMQTEPIVIDDSDNDKGFDSITEEIFIYKNVSPHAMEILPIIDTDENDKERKMKHSIPKSSNCRASEMMPIVIGDENNTAEKEESVTMLEKDDVTIWIFN